jgi:midasin
MEQLLEHTEDWESFANKDNTLSVQRREITGLIISWRRQELQYWSVLLKQHINAFESDVAPWWIKLYRLLVSGPATIIKGQSSEVTTLESHLKETASLLIEFMRGSQLGHFSPRLRMLEAFVHYLDTVRALESMHGAAWNRVRCVVSSIHRQFAQFEPIVAANFQQGTTTLEKSVSDFVRLASWKDINVQALRASAKKTHGQLFKSVRKLRELLRGPVSPILDRPLAPLSYDDANPEVIDDTLVHQVDGLDVNAANRMRLAVAHVSKPLTTIDATAKRFQIILGSNPTDSVVGIAEASEELSSDIIITSKQLADETPSTLNEENAKFVRNLELRKRKALSEMLKALKSLGFSAKVPATQLQKHRSPLFIHALPELPKTNVAHACVDRINVYHNRLHSVLPDMRSTLASHSDDIVTQDLERCHGFAESVFAAALKARER